MQSRRASPWTFIDILLVTAFVIAGAVALLRLDHPARFNNDEGGNLAKARLVSDGYRLYDEIWSDQPMLFTYALAGWWKLFGDSLAASRCLTLAFSAILLISISRLTRIAARNGPQTLAPAISTAPIWIGLIAMILLVGSRTYVKLSVSVMIGLPAIALAILSLWLLALSLGRRRPAMITLAALAGLLFALSMHTKLFTFSLLPVAAMILHPLLGRERRTAALAFAVCFVLVFGTGSIMAYGSHPEQIVTPHLLNRHALADWIIFNVTELVGLLGDDLTLTLAFVAGLAIAWFQRNRSVILPLAAWICAMTTLLFANPVWAHHRVLINAPMAVAAALGLGSAVTWSAAPFLRIIALMFLGVMGTVAVHRPILGLTELNRTGQPLQASILDALRQRAAGTRWLMTDQALYAHMAGMRTPPELAVLTSKRLRAAGGAEGMAPVFLDVLQQRKPELVLLARFPRKRLIASSVDRYLTEHYQPVIQTEKLSGDLITLYERR